MALTRLDDLRLVTLLEDPTVRAAFPCFATAGRLSRQQVKAAQKAGCVTCGSGRRTARVKQNQAQRAMDTLGQLKRCIKAMPLKQKISFKRHIGAATVRIVVPVSDRKVVKITF